jgi:hypothetical protein
VRRDRRVRAFEKDDAKDRSPDETTDTRGGATTTMPTMRRRKRADDDHDDADDGDAREEDAVNENDSNEANGKGRRTSSTGKSARRRASNEREEDEETEGRTGVDAVEDAEMQRGNTEYVGVRDVDVEALTQQYTQRVADCSTQVGVAVDAMSDEERDKVVAEVMRFVLFSSHRTFGAPITRQKIGEALQAVGGAGGKSARAGSYVIALAQRKFLEIFGYEMVESSRAQSRNKKPARTVEQAQTAPAKCYSLRSVLPAQMRRKFIDSPGDAPHRGLAIVVAALVQIAGGCISEEALFDQLSKLGVRAGDTKHPEFGDWQAVLQALVARRVFMRERTSHDDPASGFSYELAESAEVMIGYENIDKFVTETMRPSTR